jgi:ketosteroid isomerase-like protein
MLLPTRRSGILAGVSRPEYYGKPGRVEGDLEVVRAIYDAFARRDLDDALAHLSDDFELHVEGTARETGRAAPYRRHDGMREYLADVGRVWDSLELHAEDFRAVPGSVIVIGHVTAVRAGESLERAVVWTWRLRGGKAVHLRVADLGELR